MASFKLNLNQDTTHMLTRIAILLAVFLFACQSVAQEPFVVKKAILKIYEQRDIPSRSSGTIVESFMTEGAIVEHPFVLMKLDDARQNLDVNHLKQELGIAIKQAESEVELEFADKSIAVAQAELKRALESNTRYPGLVSETEVDRLRFLVDQAEAEKKKAQFNREVAVMQ